MHFTFKSLLKCLRRINPVFHVGNQTLFSQISVDPQKKKKSLFPPEQKNNALMRGIDLRGWNTALHSNVLN